MEPNSSNTSRPSVRKLRYVFKFGRPTRERVVVVFPFPNRLKYGQHALWRTRSANRVPRSCDRKRRVHARSLSLRLLRAREDLLPRLHINRIQLCVNEIIIIIIVRNNLLNIHKRTEGFFLRYIIIIGPSSHGSRSVTTVSDFFSVFFFSIPRPPRFRGANNKTRRHPSAGARARGGGAYFNFSRKVEESRVEWRVLGAYYNNIVKLSLLRNRHDRRVYINHVSAARV